MINFVNSNVVGAPSLPPTPLSSDSFKKFLEILETDFLPNPILIPFVMTDKLRFRNTQKSINHKNMHIVKLYILVIETSAVGNREDYVVLARYCLFAHPFTLMRKNLENIF